jgi:hypothetical protein
MADTTIVLHGTPLSGHTHRVALMLNALGLAYGSPTRQATSAQRRRSWRAIRWARSPCCRTAT